MIAYDRIQQIHVELSSSCNAACPNCPRNVEGGYDIPWLDKKVFTLQDFKDIFKPDLISHLRNVLFCGNYGDPVMCEDTPDIVNYIHSINPYVSVRVHTNGGMRNAKWWKSLAHAMSGANDTVIFSIDGLEDTNHIYRRNVIWDRLKSNFTTYISEGGPADWEFLIFEHNEHQLDEARMLSQQWGFKRFIPKKAFGFEYHGNHRPLMRVIDRKGKFDYFIHEPQSDGFKNKSMISSNADILDQAYDKPKDAYVRSIEDTENWVKETKDVFDHLDQYEIECMAARGQEIYVDSNFGVHPCCFLGHVSQKRPPAPDTMQYMEWLEANVGFDKINAKTHGIKQILESDYFDKIVKTWDLPHKKGRIAICSKMCAKRVNPVENLYVK